MMHPCLAKMILASGFLMGVGWTFYARLWLEKEPLTTSAKIRTAFNACPQLGILLMLLFWGLCCDAFPKENHWTILFCVVLPAYCLGHSLWGY
jgi:drug/metabolite transporter (DMT)-like permease